MSISFFDCAAESPAGRRSLCYDREALDSRKEAKPKNSVLDMAKEIGIDLLDEEQYKYLQSLGPIDVKNIKLVTHSIRRAKPRRCNIW
jgi:hypothetical protein